MSDTLYIMNKTLVCFGRVMDVMNNLLPESRVIVISDENVARLYPELVGRFENIIICSGEGVKNLATVEHIYNELMSLGADRSTFLLGIGGGIVTDITGFVASTYMRGVKFGFVSTTLLGQVDASVGGKNGVNVADYKNMVGTITHPQFVVSDVEMLKTLPVREWRAGMAEVIKSAIVGDKELFDYIMRYSYNEIYSNIDHMQYIVRRAVTVKASIVEEDERESGMRRLLNLGHTIGHAIEKLTHEVNHGEAVAIGMSLISRASVKEGLLNISDVERINDCLLKFGFNLELPASIDDILTATRKDKKKAEGAIHVVLPVAIGECEVRNMSFEEFDNMFM